MEAALLTLDLATLKTWRTDALNAMHALATGVREVSVRQGDVAVQYSEASKAKLQEYINQLQSAIRSKETGSPTHAPVYLTF